MSLQFDPNCGIAVSFDSAKIADSLRILFPDRSFSPGRAPDADDWRGCVTARGAAGGTGCRTARAEMADLSAGLNELLDAEGNPLAKTARASLLSKLDDVGSRLRDELAADASRTPEFVEWFFLNLLTLASEVGRSEGDTAAHRKRAQALASHALDGLKRALNAAADAKTDPVVLKCTLVPPYAYYVFNEQTKETLSALEPDLEKALLQRDIVAQTLAARGLMESEFGTIAQALDRAFDAVRLEGPGADGIRVPAPTSEFQAVLNATRKSVEDSRSFLSIYSNLSSTATDANIAGDEPSSALAPSDPAETPGSNDVAKTIYVDAPSELFDVGATIFAILGEVPVIGPAFSFFWSIFSIWVQPTPQNGWAELEKKFAAMIYDAIEEQKAYDVAARVEAHAQTWQNYLKYYFWDSNKDEPRVRPRKLESDKQSIPAQVDYRQTIEGNYTLLTRNEIFYPLVSKKGQFRTLQSFKTFLLTLCDAYQVGLGYKDHWPVNQAGDSMALLKKHLTENYANANTFSNGTQLTFKNYFILVSRDLQDRLRRDVEVYKDSSKTPKFWAHYRQTKTFNRVSPVYQSRATSVDEPGMRDFCETAADWARAHLRLLYMARTVAPLMKAVSDLMNKFKLPAADWNSGTDPWTWWCNTECPALYQDMMAKRDWYTRRLHSWTGVTGLYLITVDESWVGGVDHVHDISYYRDYTATTQSNGSQTYQFKVETLDACKNLAPTLPKKGS